MAIMIGERGLLGAHLNSRACDRLAGNTVDDLPADRLRFGFSLRSCTHLAAADSCGRHQHHRRKQQDHPVEGGHSRQPDYAKQGSTFKPAEIDGCMSYPLMVGEGSWWIFIS